MLFIAILREIPFFVALLVERATHAPELGVHIVPGGATGGLEAALGHPRLTDRGRSGRRARPEWPPLSFGRLKAARDLSLCAWLLVADAPPLFDIMKRKKEAELPLLAVFVVVVRLFFVALICQSGGGDEAKQTGGFEGLQVSDGDDRGDTDETDDHQQQS